ncbi:hypothetical protein TELCIR_16484 [Teladorsagia circumcincta]|uniref:NADP-dependent oxidoreductase domain-containing protein n=1 Tax=Teladorsagia circumcincta TaxID=45464 RepID=A0A2G9TVC5_TELCI|nr:hypothetical protein TELCIR_16484 [Teladorsagia circumcincta]
MYEINGTIEQGIRFLNSQEKGNRENQYRRLVVVQKFNESIRIALEAGYRLFDTAELYGTEGELGAALEAFSSLVRGNKEILDEPDVKKLGEKFDVSSQVAAIELSEDELKSLRMLDRNTAFCPRCFPWRCL